VTTTTAFDLSNKVTKLGPSDVLAPERKTGTKSHSHSQVKAQASTTESSQRKNTLFDFPLMDDNPILNADENLPEAKISHLSPNDLILLCHKLMDSVKKINFEVSREVLHSLFDRIDDKNKEIIENVKEQVLKMEEAKKAEEAAKQESSIWGWVSSIVMVAVAGATCLVCPAVGVVLLAMAIADVILKACGEDDIMTMAANGLAEFLVSLDMDPKAAQIVAVVAIAIAMLVATWGMSSAYSAMSTGARSTAIASKEAGHVIAKNTKAIAEGLKANIDDVAKVGTNLSDDAVRFTGGTADDVVRGEASTANQFTDRVIVEANKYTKATLKADTTKRYQQVVATHMTTSSMLKAGGSALSAKHNLKMADIEHDLNLKKVAQANLQAMLEFLEAMAEHQQNFIDKIIDLMRVNNNQSADMMKSDFATLVNIVGSIRSHV